MTGQFIDNIIYSKRKQRHFDNYKFLDTDYGRIRTFDSTRNNLVIINVPDGPNTIEHQLPLLKKLSKDFRVICFEYPGVGFSYPSKNFDYSFKHGSELILQVMDILKIEKASLLFSCSNGYYAMKAAMISNDRFTHLFLSQTPSIQSIINWSEKSIPSILKLPIIGQLSNRIFNKNLANIWYDIALPKESNCTNEFKEKAAVSLDHGGCFCLSSLVQGLAIEKNQKLQIDKTSVTLIWGGKDYSHRKTLKSSIKEHVRDCEIIEFEKCGHFPELENSDKFVRLVSERLYK